jgi:hypothetical protein
MVAMSFKSAPDKSKLIIRFENFVGDKKLVLDTATYTNALGQAFTVTNFKYYISNIRLMGSGGNVFAQPDGFYLIRQDDENTWTAEIEGVPADIYSEIYFTIGVDSLHNCSGAQSGALDPIHGMFWTWNTGYIFVKLEGKSPASKSPGHIFEYHIGGYKAPANFIRNATLAFKKNEPMTIIAGKTTKVYIKADAAKILQGSHPIDFSKLSSVTDFHHADKIADNYKDMFSIIRVSNEW